LALIEAFTAAWLCELAFIRIPYRNDFKIDTILIPADTVRREVWVE
jgi:hypothetical protein